MKHTVLIAEDDRILSRVLKTKFKKYKDRFEVLFALDGQEAIGIMGKKPVSLLVTDIQMPNIDGLKLLAYMGEHHPVVPCLVMSSHNPEKARERVSDDSVSFFPKPVDVDVLAGVIMQVLERDIPRGSLYGISVTGFLQMIAMEQKTCLFDIERPDGQRGRFYFDGGVLFNAVCGDLRKEEAAMALISTTEGRYRFRYVPNKVIPRQIKTDLFQLIMEAKRRELGLSPIQIAS
ncbi:MAG: response regulator [Pseudomonadota bacterium]